MQRKGYAAGAVLVAVLAAGSVSCTGSSAPGVSAADSKSGSVSAEAVTAPPGTYRDLPEPCGAVGVDVLREMLPGAEDDASAERDGGGTPSAYEGEQAVTYDNDRRVGCRWKSSTGLGSRHLLVDFERVVSYDPAVSDDERAARLYEDMALKAGIPTAPAAQEESPEAEEPEGTATEGDAPDSEETGKAAETEDAGETGGTEDGAETGAAESGEPEVATPQATSDTDLAPRPLEGVGDAAYIDDELVTADSGVHRDITLVFRTGNVIVTVRYEQWLTDRRRLPDSAELQEKALKLAGELAGRFED
ncbi:hypothetical protein GCM10010420_53830 [Streptomyces glaucosporus]|uniref:DUF3558 domain-containing protein n=1 Tax=Streptomyces glaucosporus TaxID=284044 RepID=A0ABP5W0P4_9ACTN